MVTRSGRLGKPCTARSTATGCAVSLCVSTLTWIMPPDLRERMREA